ncbi:hypothetical protein PV682_03320 [Streptomyces niveiscabiei]|uniref:nuclear transport factor 2 family protein n=1 Tax=Streptomyces niveiscabiei TaxID=164115 RepID=UPI0029B165E9|nr:hypothetical protein [Streptomyces niveiscabiei]MDX3380477.1 hypothetical protein [Streptomyces niveiscabiei]
MLRLYTEGFGKNDTDVVKQLVAAGYIQHETSVPGGADGDRPYRRRRPAETQEETNRTLAVTACRKLSDGDLVRVFSSDYSVADIFRVTNGKILEHWDVVQDGQ